jgi:chitodextrinase
MTKAVRGAGRSRLTFVLAAVVVAVALTGPAQAADPSGVVAERVAVVLVNFRNDQSQPFSAADARAWTFGDSPSVARLYQAVSSHRLALSGDAYGWLTVDRDNGTSCDVAGWEAAAAQRSRQAGIDIDAYDVVVYAWPVISSCDFRGASTIGGSRSFVNGATNRSQWVPLVGHELGHAFGAEHADAVRCVDSSGATVVISTTCRSEAYGDPFDLMGSGFRHRPNANHAAAMGMLPASAVQTVDASGEYRISPLASNGRDPRLVRVPYDRDADGAMRYLLLEFRQSSPYDEFSAEDPGVRGVMVRLGKDPDRHAPTQLLDTTPGTPTFADAPLLPDRVLTDNRRGLSIAVLDAGPDGARVSVDYPGFIADWAACDGVTVPARIGRGRTVPIEARFKNTGTTSWTAADGYELETRGITGAAVLSGTDAVAPGATGVFTGTVTAPQGLGPVTIAWRPRYGGQPFGEDCTATVDVVADADPPTPPQGLRGAVQSQSSVQLTWTPSSDNVGVKSYRVERSTDGSAFTRVADVTSTSAVVGGLGVNTPYWFRVAAGDAGDNVSAPSGVLQVQIGDITAPQPPTNLKATGKGPGWIDLGWTASSDNVGVERYRVYRRANVLSPFVFVGETTAPAFHDGGLSAQSYSYYVTAVDRVGNASARSNTASASPATCVSAGACF